MNSWRGQHKRVEQQFLAFIGTDAVLVFKGGAALCGGLWLERSVKKDTVTVQRVTVSVIIGMAFPLRCKIRFNML
ncbi:hypothetical protein [Mobiluncus mulieris]|nr:hypothetical protein [Mobiluncus mulieris]STY84357.1 Uncharacterised protein [Mobiluncus mulieris]